MQKKRLRVVLLMFTLMFVLVILVSCGKNNEANDVVEMQQKTSTAEWFENNMGWFIGIPVGSALDLILGMLFLFAKRKDYKADLMKNELQRAENSKFITDSKDTLNKVGSFITTSQELVNKASNDFNAMNKKFDDLSIKFDDLEKTNDKLTNDIEKLISIIALISSNNSDLVANGIAEEINAISTSSKNE